jgi:dipeptidyl aminopeptidase/acylaminoacyl peptidase
MLMVHGAADRQVPVQQSIALDAALRAAGVRSELLVIPDVDHSFIGKTPEATRAASLAALDRSLAFIEQVLGKP